MTTIAKTTLEDFPEIKNLLAAAWIDTYACLLVQKTVFNVIALWHELEILEKRHKNGTHFFYTAKDEKNGTVGVLVIDKIAEDAIHIADLYVRPDSQRRGTGALLLKHCSEAFPGWKKIVLEVAKENVKGINFCLKNGFITIGEKNATEGQPFAGLIIMEKSG
jgi:ribosomal protein S18 acetylase RimI-like enzyme